VQTEVDVVVAVHRQAGCVAGLSPTLESVQRFRKRQPVSVVKSCLAEPVRSVRIEFRSRM
jgi:hypothetical protein